MTTSAPQSRVVVKTPEGQLKFADRKDVLYGLQHGYFTAPTFEEQQQKIAQVEEEKSYEGFVPGLEAGAASVLRGATLEGSDVLLAKGAKLFGGGEEAEKRMKRRLEGLEEKWPLLSGAGEMVGFVGPLLAAPYAAAPARGAQIGLAAAAKVGAKTAIRGLGAIPRAVTGLGEMAAAKTAGVVGKGLGGRVATAAVQNAVEGALIEGGAALSETALSDHPELTAELILPRIAKGALTGTAFGAAMPVAGAAASKVGQATKAQREKAAKWLNEIADDRMFQSLDPSARQFREVEKYVGALSRGERAKVKALGTEEVQRRGTQEMGRLYRQEVKRAGKTPGMMTVEDAEILGRDLRKEFGPVGSQIVESVDDIGRPKGIDLLNQLIDHSESLKDPLADVAYVKKFDELVDEFVERGAKQEADGTLKLKDIHDMRIKYDKEARFKQLEPESAEKLAKRDFSRVLEDFISDHLYETGQRMNQPIAETYFNAKKQYQLGSYLEEIGAESRRRGEKNQRFSLGDKLMFIAGMAHAPLSALGLSLGNKVMRERGDQIAADLAGRAADIVSLNKAAASAKEEMALGVKSFLSETGKSKGLVKVPLTLAFSGKTEKERAKSYNDYVEALDKRVANPQEQFAQVANRIGNLSQVAPQTTAALVQAKIRQDEILRSKQPKGRQNADEIFPTKAPPQISDDEMSKFSRYVAVAENGPQVLVEELKHKMVNPETVEAVKTMYPASFEAMKAQIMQEATTREKDLSYSQKLQLSRLFGIPSDFSTKPETIQTFQGTFKPTQPAGGAGPSKGKKPPSVAGQFMTTSQRVEQGER